MRLSAWHISVGLCADASTLALVAAKENAHDPILGIRNDVMIRQVAYGGSWFASVSFSADGSWLVSGSHDQKIKLWSAPLSLPS